jgi:hypothetical protein
MKIESEIERLLQILDSADSTGAEVKRPMTFWLPASYKDAYDVIQKRSGRKFSHLLIEVIKMTIDRARRE